MPIAKRIVGGFGGLIVVESVPGQGATTIITLP
jgi:signal transduction histidine kinase